MKNPGSAQKISPQGNTDQNVPAQSTINVTDVDALKKFREAKWDEITPLLVKYSVFKVKRLEWKSGSVLPKGMLPEDIALNAVRKTCEGLISEAGGKGIRLWDPVKEPDLLEFLKSVVDSDVNALVMSAEHRLTNYAVDLHDFESYHSINDSGEDQVDLSGPVPTLGRHTRTPEDVLISLQTEHARESEARDVIEWLYSNSRDDEEALMVLMAFEEAAKNHDKVKPSLIAKYSGLDEGKIRNAMRRLSRKVVKRK